MKRIAAIFTFLVAAEISCSTPPETSTITQGVGFCPYPPVYCRPTQEGIDLWCSDACAAQGGVSAWCPPVTDLEYIHCADECSVYHDEISWQECDYRCISGIRHQCVGGWEPTPPPRE